MSVTCFTLFYKWRSRTIQGILTINRTHRLYQYQRLPYGVTLAPAIWQWAMDQIPQGIPGVFYYQGDVIVASCTSGEHLEQFMALLKRLEEYGLEVNQEKCKFLRSFVEYLKELAPISRESQGHH